MLQKQKLMQTIITSSQLSEQIHALEEMKKKILLLLLVCIQFYKVIILVSIEIYALLVYYCMPIILLLISGIYDDDDASFYDLQSIL